MVSVWTHAYWEQPLMAVFFRTGLGLGAALAIAVPATLAMATLTWHLVERPVLARWGQGAARRPARAAIAAA